MMMMMMSIKSKFNLIILMCLIINENPQGWGSLYTPPPFQTFQMDFDKLCKPDREDYFYTFLPVSHWWLRY